MISLLLAAATAFMITILLTPVAMKALRRRDIGQFIQEDVHGHMHKRGTPTMGGVVIIFGALLGYVGAHFRLFTLGEGIDLRMYPFTPEGLLAVLAFVGMGFIGFLDDFVKYAREHNQGLSKRWKFLLALVAMCSIFRVRCEVTYSARLHRLTPVFYRLKKP